MRPLSGERLEYDPHERGQLSDRWFRAGFNGIAYRLGHLFVSRPLALFGAATLFYLV